MTGISLRAYAGPFWYYFLDSSQNCSDRSAGDPIHHLVQFILPVRKHPAQMTQVSGSWKVPVYGHRAGDLALGTSEAWPVQALLWLREDSPEL